MLSAPASIPPTTLAAFAVALGEGTVSPSSRSYKPAHSASRRAGDQPRGRHQVLVIEDG